MFAIINQVMGTRSLATNYNKGMRYVLGAYCNQ